MRVLKHLSSQLSALYSQRPIHDAHRRTRLAEFDRELEDDIGYMLQPTDIILDTVSFIRSAYESWNGKYSKHKNNISQPRPAIDF